MLQAYFSIYLLMHGSPFLNFLMLGSFHGGFLSPELKRFSAMIFLPKKFLASQSISDGVGFCWKQKPIVNSAHYIHWCVIDISKISPLMESSYYIGGGSELKTECDKDSKGGGNIIGERWTYSSFAKLLPRKIQTNAMIRVPSN